MIKEKRKRDSGPDILPVNHAASIHNHKGRHASGALKGTSTPTVYHITPPPPVTSSDWNRHHLQRSERSLWTTCCRNKNQRPTPSPGVVEFSTPNTLFLRLPSSSCPDWPWLHAQEQTLADFADKMRIVRQTTQYRPGADRDTEGDVWTGVKIGRERVTLRGGGGVGPRGVEVKRAKASICNSSEACVQWITLTHLGLSVHK